MSTQRPFFYNFLAAFRAHSALKSATTASNPSVPGATASLSTAAATAANFSSSEPIPMTSSAVSAARSQQAQATHNKPSTSAAALVSAFSPSSPSHSPSTNHHHHHTRRPNPTATTNAPVSRSTAFSPRTPRRRGSDTSSEGGFRDTLGGEKWFIGGRTAMGEERFYRLTMATRERSGDRASLDRMSL